MENTKVSRHCPQAGAPGLAITVAADKIEEMCELLCSLKVAVEDVRTQLAAKRKGLYTVPEIADLVGRSSYTIRRWISEGRIRAIRIEGTGPKGRLLIARDQLDALISQGMGADIPGTAVG